MTHPLAHRLRVTRELASVRVLTYGEDGIGKTRFGKEAPNPLFIAAESEHLPRKIPSIEPADWKDLLGIVHALQDDPMDRKTIVLDTVDWLEPKAVLHVCTRDNGMTKTPLILPDGTPYIEGYGYNHGSDVLATEWRLLLVELDRLRTQHGMNIVLLAHARAHRFKNAGGDDYGVIGPSVDKKAADLLCQWSDAVLYAEFDRQLIQAPEKSASNGKAKVVTQGHRICWTQHRGAHRAKNRFSMPASISFSWREFAKYALADIDALQKQIEVKLLELADTDLENKVRKYLNNQPEESGILIQTLEQLNRRSVSPKPATDESDALPRNQFS